MGQGFAQSIIWWGLTDERCVWPILDRKSLDDGALTGEPTPILTPTMVAMVISGHHEIVNKPGRVDHHG